MSPTRAATRDVADLDGVASVLWTLRHVRRLRTRENSSRGQDVLSFFNVP